MAKADRKDSVTTFILIYNECTIYFLFALLFYCLLRYDLLLFLKLKKSMFIEYVRFNSIRFASIFIWRQSSPFIGLLCQHSGTIFKPNATEAEVFIDVFYLFIWLFIYFFNFYFILCRRSPFLFVWVYVVDFFYVRFKGSGAKPNLNQFCCGKKKMGNFSNKCTLHKISIKIALCTPNNMPRLV